MACSVLVALSKEPCGRRGREEAHRHLRRPIEHVAEGLDGCPVVCQVVVDHRRHEGDFSIESQGQRHEQIARVAPVLVAQEAQESRIEQQAQRRIGLADDGQQPFHGRPDV